MREPRLRCALCESTEQVRAVTFAPGAWELLEAHCGPLAPEDAPGLCAACDALPPEELKRRALAMIAREIVPPYGRRHDA